MNLIQKLVTVFSGGTSSQQDPSNDQEWMKDLHDWEERKQALREKADRHGCQSVRKLLETNQVARAEELLSGLD